IEHCVPGDQPNLRHRHTFEEDMVGLGPGSGLLPIEPIMDHAGIAVFAPWGSALQKSRGTVAKSVMNPSRTSMASPLFSVPTSYPKACIVTQVFPSASGDTSKGRVYLLMMLHNVSIASAAL